ncbi:helix-turn-helix domain-containing protein [Leptobacterium flavescens]|uniref:Helix-turn-helix domain-containing protein n=1 Tax=Leptobacterium flavescens TaxID=472055 RepID=A0A6P0UWB9_9FLAO|nr:AraC family transcriptional regulator [Leptobacterium flavescens]NER14726.1 helix-turn-helix domain-containing protein [Leptobacterium flavescens]
MEKGDKGQTSALYVWNGLSVFWGTSFHTNPHSHNTLQLVFDIDKEFLLKDSSTEWTAYSAAIIQASHMHQLDSNNSIQLFLYLDKDSEYAKKLTEKYLNEKSISNLKNSDIRRLSNDFFKGLLVKQDCDELFKGCHTILEHLIRIEPLTKRDKRIEDAISFIVNSPEKQFKIKDVASHVCLSESRLRHLFKEQVGQPIQSFILWMKVVDSLNLVLKGRSLTQTAYDTGFWDHSHMNRSYKDLLGTTPGAIQKYEQELRIISCNKSNFYSLKTEISKDWNADKPFKTIEIQKP